jgi:hypothetical protein
MLRGYGRQESMDDNHDISTPRALALAMDNTLTHYTILNKPAAYTSAAICICTVQILAPLLRVYLVTTLCNLPLASKPATRETLTYGDPVLFSAYPLSGRHIAM